MDVRTWQDVTTGADGTVGVGSGWTSSTAWLVAAAVIAGLALVTWWITRRGRRRGRGEELALRRYALRGHTRSGRPARRDGGRPDRAGPRSTGIDETSS